MNHLARAMVWVAVFGCGWDAAFGSSISADPSGALPTAAANRRDADFHHRTRTAIQEVLAAPEFADLHADPNAGWSRLLEWFESLMEAIASGLRRLPGWAAWALVTWMALTLLAILAHLIYTLVSLLGSPSRTSRAEGRTPEHPSLLLGLLPLDFDAMYAEARRLLVAGDWMAATKHFYVATILWLDRQGYIAFRLSKTNRDYIEELVTRTALQADFRRLTGCFEPVVYGGQSATMSTAHDMANKIEDLVHDSAGRLAG